MFRFDARVGFYLYPEAEGGEDRTLWMNRGSTFEKNVTPRDDVSVTKHGLKIPTDAASYADFTAKMAAREREFRQVFPVG